MQSYNLQSSLLFILGAAFALLTNATSSASADESAESVPLIIPMTWNAQASVFTVDVNIGNANLKLIVDSGSSNQVINDSTAKLLGIDTSKLPEVGKGKDHAGNPVPIKVLAMLNASMASHEVTLNNVVIIPDNPDMSKLGIGGVLSPQLLFDNPIQLDFARQEWLVNPKAMPFALEKTSKAYWYKKNKIFTEIAAEAHAPVLAMLDTGSGTTKFEADYLGRSLKEMDCAVRGVAGCGKGQRDDTPTKISFAGKELTLASVVLQKEIRHSDKTDERALIGMSILRFCSITINHRLDEQIGIACMNELPKN